MAPAKRFYFLDPASYLAPFTNSPPLFHTKSRFDFNRSLDKCRSGHFTGIVFSENWLDHRELPDYIKSTVTAGLVPVLHTSANQFTKRRPFLLHLAKNSPIGLNISFTDSRDLPLDQIQSFPKQLSLFTFVLTKHSHPGQLPSWILKDLELYCPYKRSLTDPFLTPRQVYHFLKKQTVPLKPFQGNIYDERICSDMDLEPVIKPFIKNLFGSGTAIRFSIIIPSYNNKTQLSNTLEKLKNQNYPKDQYEMIPVDDGSNDDTLNMLQDFTRKNSDLNISAIHFPRVIPRIAGVIWPFWTLISSLLPIT